MYSQEYFIHTLVVENYGQLPSIAQAKPQIKPSLKAEVTFIFFNPAGMSDMFNISMIFNMSNKSNIYNMSCKPNWLDFSKL